MTGAGRAALAAAAACLFLGSWALLHHLWYGSTRQIVDTPGYEQHADAVAAGAVPYRDFALEYPPGALVPFLAPRLTAPSGDLAAYDRAFERWLGGAGALLTLLAAAGLAALRAPPVRTAAALLLVAATPLLLGNLLLTRFDLWPAALTAGALAALLAERDAAGGLLLGAAVATKLYPAVLVPLGIAWVWRRRDGRAALRWTALVVAVCAAAYLPFAVLAPGGIGHSLDVQLARPLQLESLGAAVLIAAHHAGGLALQIRTDHGSQNVEGSLPTAVAAATSALQVLALCAVWLAFAAGPARRERLAAAAAAAVAVFVAFGKVLSPQFLVWLVPLVPLVRSRLAAPLLAASLVLTQLWFPGRYWQLANDLRPFVSWLLLARDVLLVALAAVLVRTLLGPEPLGDQRSRIQALQRVRAQPD